MSGPRISPSFGLRAFAQPALVHRGLLAVPYPADCIDPWLVRLCLVLEQLRVAFSGREVLVLSGYRSPLYNSATGRPAQDEHSQGRAVDVQVRSVSPDDVVLALYDLADRGEVHIGGVGRHALYTHIDVRPLQRGRQPRYWETPGLPPLPLIEPTLCLGCEAPVNRCKCSQITVTNAEPQE